MTVADTLTVTFDKTDQVGDELWEVFARLSTGPGAWSKAETVPDSGSTPQSIAVDGRLPLTEYDLAIRCQRGGLVPVGYESSNPDNWDAATAPGAKVDDQPTSALALEITSAVWSRTSDVAEKVALVFAAPPAGCAVEVHVSANGVDFSLDGTTAPDATTYDYDGSAVGETARWFKLRAKRGALVGAFGAAVRVWIGPLKPEFVSTEEYGPGQWLITWTNNVSVGWTEGKNHNGDVFTFLVLVPINWKAVESDNFLGVELRHNQTAFTVEDYSEWVVGFS